MRVFVAGATGVLGSRLVPMLVSAGHEVTGTYRHPGKDVELRGQGAEAVPLDLLDAGEVRDAVSGAHADVVVHQATALAGSSFGRSLDKTFTATNELRTRGTDNLLAAAAAAGVDRFLAQSFASMRNERTGSWVKSEDDPLDPEPVATMQQTHAAMRYLEDAVTGAGGIVLRYGGFYGGEHDGMVGPVRKRQFPVVGSGAGVTSFVHVEDAAAATVLALEADPPAGIYNIVDDDPAPAREWLPVLAEALGAKPPRHAPVWLAALVAGRAAVTMSTEARGASNAKAKRVLGWTPRFSSWREGFFAAYAQ